MERSCCSMIGQLEKWVVYLCRREKKRGSSFTNEKQSLGDATAQTAHSSSERLLIPTSFLSRRFLPPSPLFYSLSKFQVVLPVSRCNVINYTGRWREPAELLEFRRPFEFSARALSGYIVLIDCPDSRG